MNDLKPEPAKTTEKGLSAIELLVAMAIFLIVMSSVYGVLKIGNISRNTVNSRTENIKNVRMALNSIGREVVNAGLGYNRIGGTVPDNFTFDNFGLPADPDSDYDLLTAISEGTNISESDLSKKGEKNDVVAFAFRDFQFNNGYPIVINNVSQNGNTLVLKTPDGACANCRPYDLFLIETSDGKQALILSTDIVDGNQIVLGDADPLHLNYGNPAVNSGLCIAGDLLCISKANSGSNSGSGNNGGSNNSGQGNSGGSNNGGGINIGLGGINIGLLGGGGNNTDKSSVKKCKTGVTTNCINYGSTSVVAKKIYLVSYSVGADGTLMRTTFGNNTGAGPDEQIVRQPIANGVRSFKIQYLLSDGTVTTDPAQANIHKEKCNDIIQIEVSITVEAEGSSGAGDLAEPITLTSTFSTRNLKYDVY